MVSYFACSFSLFSLFILNSDNMMAYDSETNCYLIVLFLNTYIRIILFFIYILLYTFSFLNMYYIMRIYFIRVNTYNIFLIFSGVREIYWFYNYYISSLWTTILIEKMLIQTEWNRSNRKNFNIELVLAVTVNRSFFD